MSRENILRAKELVRNRRAGGPGLSSEDIPWNDRLNAVTEVWLEDLFLEAPRALGRISKELAESEGLTDSDMNSLAWETIFSLYPMGAPGGGTGPTNAIRKVTVRKRLFGKGQREYLEHTLKREMTTSNSNVENAVDDAFYFLNDLVDNVPEAAFKDTDMLFWNPHIRPYTAGRFSPKGNAVSIASWPIDEDPSMFKRVLPHELGHTHQYNPSTPMERLVFSYQKALADTHAKAVSSSSRKIVPWLPVQEDDIAYSQYLWDPTEIQARILGDTVPAAGKISKKQYEELVSKSAIESLAHPGVAKVSSGVADIGNIVKPYYPDGFSGHRQDLMSRALIDAILDRKMQQKLNMTNKQYSRAVKDAGEELGATLSDMDLDYSMQLAIKKEQKRKAAKRAEMTKKTDVSNVATIDELDNLL
jgi:hypothetical protein